MGASKDCIIGNYSGCKVANAERQVKTSFWVLIIESTTDRIIAKTTAPFSDLNWPDTFCLTLTFRIALLFVEFRRVLRT